MPFIDRKEFANFQEAIVVAVYSDRISVYAVERKAGGLSILAGVTEEQEEGELHAEKIKLNCQKAFQQLPREYMKSGMPVVFALGPEVSECDFVPVDAKREQKDALISENEVKSIIEKPYGLKAAEAGMVSRNVPAGFFVDGFSVPDPVGLNGRTITVNLISVRADRALEEVFSGCASLYGFRYAGMVNMCGALADTMPLFTTKSDCVAVLVFQREIEVVLVRDGKAVAIGKADGGYGILEQEIAKLFSVGREEAKSIARAFENKRMEAAAAQNIGELFQRVIPGMLERVGTTLLRLDVERLIPPTFLIAQFGYYPQVSEALTGSQQWFSHARVARNALVERMTPLARNIQDDKQLLHEGDVLLLTALISL